MANLYFWIGLLILVVLVPLGMRLVVMRPWAVRRWRGAPQRPLDDDELASLFYWQSRNLALFVMFVTVGVLDAVLTALRWLDGALPFILWVVFLLLGLTGLAHHLARRCPRCGMPIGVQSNLLLPKRCDRCRVAFRREAGVRPNDRSAR